MRARLERGVMAGFQVVDVRVTLYDGSYHSVDSSDIAFQLAGQIAAEKAVLEARPCLLEPVMDVEVTAPSAIAGDVIGDLNSRRGKIAGMEPGDESSVVRAQVPMAEMLNYEPHLRSMSGGRGSYSMEFSHYEELPGMLTEKVVAEAKKEKEARAAEKH